MQINRFGRRGSALLALPCAWLCAAALLPGSGPASSISPPPGRAACFAEGTPEEVVNRVNRALGLAIGNGQDYWIGASWTNQGVPATLTWSLVPDGLAIDGGVGEAAAPSNLFAQMDAKAPRSVWLAMFEQVFQRWSVLSGTKYVRVTDGINDWDDGAAWFTDGNGTTRGDIRISMHRIDGANGILAYNYFPTTSDMVLDAGDMISFGNNAGNYRFLRNVVAHEAGHGLGFYHVCPANSSKLMEPFVSTSYDGPRHDDVRALQFNYGDIYETNNTPASATPLSLEPGATLTLGTVPMPTPIPNGSTVSLSSPADVDWYRFTNPYTVPNLSVVLTPLGLTYDSAEQTSSGCPTGNTIDSLRMINLNFQIIAANGTTVVTTVAAQPAGGVEQLVAFNQLAPGDYFIRVYGSGSQNETQLYQLDVTLSGCSPPVFTQQPASQTLHVGENITLKLMTTRPYYNFAYQWRKNGVPLVDDGRIDGGLTPTLVINDAQASDAGSYDCVVNEVETDCTGTTQTATLSLAAACPGDLDGNRAIDLADVAIMLSSYGSAGPLGDVDHNGSVDLADLTIVLGLYGTTCP